MVQGESSFVLSEDVGCYAFLGFSEETGDYAILGIAGIRYITYRQVHPAPSPILLFNCFFKSYQRPAVNTNRTPKLNRQNASRDKMAFDFTFRDIFAPICAPNTAPMPIIKASLIRMLCSKK